MGTGLKAKQMTPIDPMTASGRKGKEEYCGSMVEMVGKPSTKAKPASADGAESQTLFGGKKPA